MAHSGHGELRNRCRYWGVKRTWVGALHMSAYDPKRTCLGGLSRANLNSQTLFRVPATQMRRREVITLLGGAVTWPLAVRAQQQPMSVIGLLSATAMPIDQLKAIQTGLNEGGYFEGRNLAIIYRSADGQFDRLPML